jgi:hypothetical protein
VRFLAVFVPDLLPAETKPLQIVAIVHGSRDVAALLMNRI